MPLNRRSFLHLTALGAVTALTSPTSASSSGPSYAAPALEQPELLALMSAQLVRVLGMRYRQEVPTENDARALRAAIAVRIPWTDSLTGSSQSAVLRLIQRDFAEGRTVLLDGWVLSITEARQCALYSLLPGWGHRVARMHTDARTLPNGSLLEGDLCIVGAGAAGISMALEWPGASRRVLLLEGGGFEVEPAMQDLYRGEIVGQPYYPLEAARLHCFGGTTGHWAGFCAQFDPIDFEVRDWVPHSGWPFPRETLEPFYERAQRVLELGPYDYDAAGWQRRDSTMVPLETDRRAVWTKMWQFSPPTRFGARYRDAIVGARNVHLYTYANVCEVEANEALTAVTGLRVRTPDGREHTVRARHYVLACCSIQNARLLLASNRRATAGLGNAHDLVGRFFMEHLEMPGGHLVMPEMRAAKTAMYVLQFGRTKARGELALGPALQRQHRILNSTASLTPAAPGQVAKSTFQNFTPEVLDAFMRAQKGDTSAFGILRRTLADPAAPLPDPRFFNLITRQEQAPNPNSRITLGRERDAMGMPRVRLDWRLTDLDRRTFRVFYEALGTELGRSGLGRVQLLDWVVAPDGAWPSFLSGGWHHMGTTRMHADPKQGVVDADCRVHGLANLSVAGAAVFPTAGAANPTLTLVAMSLRLSDHLKTKLA